MPELMLITESPSHYRHLEKMTINEILKGINKEDSTVTDAIALVLPQIHLNKYLSQTGPYSPGCIKHRT